MANDSQDQSRPDAATSGRGAATAPPTSNDDYAALAAYNRTLRGLDQFERAKRKAENRLANRERLKARRAAG